MLAGWMRLVKNNPTIWLAFPEGKTVNRQMCRCLQVQDVERSSDQSNAFRGAGSGRRTQTIIEECQVTACVMKYGLGIVAVRK